MNLLNLVKQLVKKLLQNCRKKNKKINWAEIGRQLGCDPQTAQRVLKETGLTYLFDDSKNTYLDKV